VPILVLLASLAFGQDAKPDFTGTWQIISRHPSDARPKTEIKQAENTLSIKHLLDRGNSTDWAVYPTDGTVKTTKDGRHTITRTGQWEGRKLILKETGPGNAPWRRSTMHEELTLSDDGRTLTTFFSYNDRSHDHTITSERVH
jgi:hypothetical protein